MAPWEPLSGLPEAGASSLCLRGGVEGEARAGIGAALAGRCEFRRARARARARRGPAQGAAGPGQ